MNRRNFLSMLAAIPIIGKLASKPQPLAATRSTIPLVSHTPMWVQRPGGHTAFLPSSSDFGVDMYVYPTQQLEWLASRAS